MSPFSSLDHNNGCISQASSNMACRYPFVGTTRFLWTSMSGLESILNCVLLFLLSIYKSTLMLTNAWALVLSTQIMGAYCSWCNLCNWKKGNCTTADADAATELRTTDMEQTVFQHSDAAPPQILNTRMPHPRLNKHGGGGKNHNEWKRSFSVTLLFLTYYMIIIEKQCVLGDFLLVRKATQCYSVFTVKVCIVCHWASRCT